MPLSDKQREALVAVTETWYGTPYRGCSCLKGAGTDCGQLIKGVYIEAGHKFDDGIPTPEHYSLDVAQHKRSTEYIDIVSKYMREIPESEVKPGDVVVYQLGLAFAHAAIIKSWPKHVIHALKEYGVTAGDGMNHKFGRRKKKFFTLKDEFIGEEK